MIIHLDLSTGVSGDKLLAALLDVAEQTGAYTLARLQADLASLVPEVRVIRTQVLREGILAPHLEVSEQPTEMHDAHAHGHRSWEGIRKLIEDSSLPARARAYALSSFSRIAEVEARIHGTSVEEVHFHEVGALDSIVDIVGCSLLRCALEMPHGDESRNITHDTLRVTATPIAVGSGTLTCEHGILPVPAPATARLILGLPAEAGCAHGELTTPTGAALVADMVSDWGPLPPMRPLAVGCGAGSRQLPGVPNVLTAIMGSSLDTSDPPFRSSSLPGDAPSPIDHVEGVFLLEANLDHLSGEAASFACDEILSEGALDVWQEPLAMKKGRIGIGLRVLVQPLDVDRLAKHIQLVTGTLGVRRSYLERYVADRGEDELVTSHGRVRFKSMCVQDADGKTSRCWVRPEADDVASLLGDGDSPYARMATGLADEADRMMGDRLPSSGTDNA